MSNVTENLPEYFQTMSYEEISSTYMYDYGSTTETILANTTLHPVFQLPNNTLTKVFIGTPVKLLIPLLAMFVVCINGINLMSSGLILKHKISPRTTYMFLGNVALCDMLTGLTLGIGIVFPMFFQRTHLVCCIGQGLMISSCLASVWSIGLIAIDRFLYIIHGMNYTRWLNSRRAWILILMSWLIGVVPSFLPALGWDTGLSDNGRICWFVYITPVPIIGLIGVIGLTPMVINCSLYLVILYFALKKVVQLRKADKGISEVKGMRISRGGASNNTLKGKTEAEKQTASKWKAIKIVLLTSGAFIITWGPYLVSCIIYSLCKDRESCKPIAVLIASPFNMLAFMNSILNPFIYAWWHKPFRNNVAKFFCFTKRSNTTTKNTKHALNNSSMSSNIPTTMSDIESERL